jgi:hypothetical protein
MPSLALSVRFVEASGDECASEYCAQNLRLNDPMKALSVGMPGRED